MFEGFAQQRVAVAHEVAISCVIGGSGAPVLLLHGFPQSLAMWARVAPLLVRAGFTVVAADLRGYGDSAKPDDLPDHAPYAFRAMAADQVALMRHLGFPAFHMIGHDRGGRTGHRMALDRPDVVRSLAVLDIVPTHAMLTETNRHVAHAYWHWYFLSQPAPFPERMIGNDPDLFYEACLFGWGAARAGDFGADMLAEYRRCWRDPEMIRGSCCDYRAAASIDLAHDDADLDRKVACPTLALFGANGLMARCFDIPAAWRRRCSNVQADSLPGGHFFVDLLAEATAERLIGFLRGVPAKS